LYWDQISLIYKRYRVDRTVVRLVAVPVNQTDIYEWTAICTAPNVTTVIGASTTDVVLEKLMVQSVKLQGSGAMAAAEMVWDLPTTLSTGLTRLQLDANAGDYSALVSASPTRIPLLQIAAANISANAAQAVRMTAFIQYEIEFFDIAVVAQS